VAVLVEVIIPAETVKFPLPITTLDPDWHPAPTPACTLKVVVPAAVPAGIVRVSVDVVSPPVLVTKEGLNVAVVPLGNPEVTLRGEVHDVLFPLKLTVTVYSTELPAGTGLGDCALTVTVFGLASVNVPVTATADVRPTAV
jgi:hypothetical protein